MIKYKIINYSQIKDDSPIIFLILETPVYLKNQANHREIKSITVQHGTVQQKNEPSLSVINVLILNRIPF